MWRRPVVTILMLIIAAILTQPLRAQQRIVAPTLRSACADVAPTLRSACADVAASLPRHGGVPIGSGQVPPPLRPADLKVSATSAAGTSPGNAASPAKPFTQGEKVQVVRRDKPACS